MAIAWKSEGLWLRSNCFIWMLRDPKDRAILRELYPVHHSCANFACVGTKAEVLATSIASGTLLARATWELYFHRPGSTVILAQRMLSSLRASPAALHILCTSRLTWRAPFTAVECPHNRSSSCRRFTATALAMGKRKADDAESSGAASKKKDVPPEHDLVNPKRVRILKDGDVGSGPVIYWYAAGVGSY